MGLPIRFTATDSLRESRRCVALALVAWMIRFSGMRIIRPTRGRATVSENGQRHAIEYPPSTGITTPVMNAAAGEHRNNTGPAISSGRPQRRIGVRSKIG